MQRAMRCVDEREREDDMTGLDCLKEELLKRGCTKQQADSKVVPVVLEILANNGTPYTEMEEAKNELSRIKNSIPDALQARYYQVEAETRILENRLRDLQVAILNRKNEYEHTPCPTFCWVFKASSSDFSFEISFCLLFFPEDLPKKKIPRRTANSPPTPAQFIPFTCAFLWNRSNYLLHPCKGR